MTSFNLPPGCSVNDIPGNRPEDAEDEAFWAALAERMSLDIPDNLYDADWFMEAINVARDLGYHAGAAEARYEAELDHALEQEDL